MMIDGDLELRGVSKAFGNQTVLRDVDLRVPSGGLAAIVGPSGSGKTTLLRMIAGFERPDSGEIRLGGDTLAVGRDSAPGRWIPPERRGIGIVPQEGALFPHLDVAANVGFGLPRTLSRSARADRVGQLLDLVGLAGFERRRPSELSGGQQHRVALARALAPRPRVVLLDEPFSALDAALRHDVRDQVTDALRMTGTTGLLVTHDQAEALSTGDPVVVLLDGTVSQSGTPTEVYERPANEAVARFIGRANLLSARVTDGVAYCALGSAPVADTRVDGEVSLVVRPERLSLLPFSTSGAVATVERVAYGGHDAIVELRLDDSTPLTARSPVPVAVSPGERVTVRIVGDVHTIAVT